MLACLLSPGPLTTQPITATVMRLDARDSRAATPASAARSQVWMLSASSWKNRAGGAAAARAGHHHRREGAQPHGLQDLLRHDHLARAVAARLGRERDADGVADALPAAARPSPRWRRRCPCCPCPPRSGPGAADSRSGARGRGRRGSDPARRSPCRKARCDLPGRPSCFGARSAFQRGDDQRLAHHLAGVQGCGRRALSSIMRASSS